MGTTPSKPPPTHTSVRAYPGSNRRQNGNTDEDAVYHGPPPTFGGDGSAVSNEGIMTAPAPPPPVAVSEHDIVERTSEDRDMVLDDEESVSGKPCTEVTTKAVNKQQTIFNHQVQLLDTRAESGEKEPTPRPSVEPGELWSDPDFPMSVAMKGMSDQVQWVRPKTFLKNPCLFSDDTTRYDIEQGSAGTCWFLSIIQSLADKPEYINSIIPEGSYPIDTDAYDGIFHCRFWVFGGMVDVYVDDFLPVMNQKPWGARSKTDPNELWVALIEKAFAKFHGSYHDACGGMAHHAFTSLAAGTSEVIELDTVKPKAFYRRIKNSLSCGSILTASVLRDGVANGLVGNHSYTITGLSKVVYRKKYVTLVRIRNPWGDANGEWRGAWSDGAPQWRELSPEDKASIEQTSKGDGEFWMTLTDFFQYFSAVSICNFTPDVDLDGKTDDMDQCWNIYSEWLGESAAGFKDKMKNPKFEFEIPEKGVPKGGTPLVVEFVQELENGRKSNDELSIRADLFKVEAVVEDAAGSPCRLLYDLTTPTTYFGGETVASRYPALQPGKYLLVPHYMQEPGQERQFLLRLFTQIKIQCWEVKETTRYYITELERGFQQGDKAWETPHVERFYGAWVAEKNAGGQVSNKTVHTNPQYQFNIRGAGTPYESPCSISLCQDITQPSVPLGIRLFKTKPVPMSLDWIYQHYDESPPNTKDSQTVFINGPEARSDFVLLGGEYILLIHADAVDQEATYFVQIATQYKSKYAFKNVEK